jgi:hypothetical protein
MKGLLVMRNLVYRTIIESKYKPDAYNKGLASMLADE